MPSTTLVRQIELLYDELCAARPDKQERYSKLARIAQELAAEHRQLIDPQQVEALVTSFLEQAPPDECTAHPDTAELLIAAVLDEHLGRKNAVASLQTWLADPARFSSTWVTATERLCQAAQSCLPKK